MDKKPPILKLNEKMIRMCQLIEQQNRHLNRLQDDVDVIKSYINEIKKKQENRENEEVKKKEPIQSGWFWS